jgi:hypothetical protein
MTVGSPADRQTPDGAQGLESARFGARRTPVELRVVVALTLIAAGVVWAIARGLQSYGLAPVGIVYDLDQPPLLLVLVGAWLWYRSARR